MCNHNKVLRCRSARFSGLALAAAVMSTFALGTSGTAHAAASKFVLQCPPTIVAQCKSGYKRQCLKYTNGCCTKVKCVPNF